MRTSRSRTINIEQKAQAAAAVQLVQGPVKIPGIYELNPLESGSHVFLEIFQFEIGVVDKTKGGLHKPRVSLSM